ncbi:MAG: hypothetical protein H7070_15100 [Saprospiraceae bacterium]|nr:hypothetical protein [Pyrinomonadaceae bacterium]
MINVSKWKETRKKGFLQFVIVNGILFFGVPMTIATAAIRFYFGSPGTDSWREYLVANGTWIGFILQALISGIVFGVFIWFITERSYRAAAKSNIETDEA